MAISFSKALGFNETALLLREQRTELLARNIVNADTPGYKAQDIDFEAALKQMDAANQSQRRQALATAYGAGGSQTTTHANVLLSAEAQALYRQPSQASLDGNTVDEHLENAAFAENSLRHQASFQFLNGKFTGMIKALRGE